MPFFIARYKKISAETIFYFIGTFLISSDCPGSPIRLGKAEKDLPIKEGFATKKNVIDHRHRIFTRSLPAA